MVNFLLTTIISKRLQGAGTIIIRKASSIVVEANKPKRVVERGTVEKMWGGWPVISIPS